MIEVTINLRGVGRANATITIESESPYDSPNNDLLDFVVEDAVRRAKAALAAEPSR